MTDVPTLLPCPNPWCATHEPDSMGIPFVDKLRGRSGYRVTCPYCPMGGPIKRKRLDAIAAWNTRHTPPPPSGSEVSGLVERATLREPSWVRSIALSDAAEEAERAATAMLFADDVSDEHRKGSGAAVRLIAMSLRIMASRAAPPLDALERLLPATQGPSDGSGLTDVEREGAFEAAQDCRMRLAAKGVDLSDDARTIINKCFLAFAKPHESGDAAEMQERCARVADGFEQDYRGGSGGSFREARRSQSANIAAAIRALDLSALIAPVVEQGDTSPKGSS